MDAHNFENWRKSILPKLEKGSVLVMDIASYHSRIEKVPTSATRKAEIQNWLKAKNINYDENDLKAHLLQKVKEEKHKYRSYVVDEMAKECEVTVLRLNLTLPLRAQSD